MGNITSLLAKMFEFFTFSKRAAISNGLSVTIKANTGDSVYVELDPRWDIKNVKDVVAKKLGISADELKIIFAGKELQENMTIRDCDLGQRSVLHAVKTRRRVPTHLLSGDDVIRERLDSIQSDGGFKSMSESLVEHDLKSLQLADSASPDTSPVTHPPNQTKAHFYVYCSQCEKLVPGKLRVRCSICKGGAFTVHRDPENWSDVLKPHRIRGHCECNEEVPCVDSEEDRPPFAEFYFKCAEHPSEGEGDFSAPLSLIKTNVNQIPCLACFGTEDLVLVFPCASGHVTCLDCFRNYLSTKLLERNFVKHPEFGYTVACPVGCENSEIEEIHHFKLLSKADYDRYQRFATEEFVLQNGGVLCPQPGCGMGLLVDAECTRVQCQNGCGFVFCRNCLQGFHLGDCLTEEQLNTSVENAQQQQQQSSAYRIDANRAADSSYEASKTAIRILTKPCPKCRTPTERAGGCMHMVCTRAGCAFEWCWICQTKFTPDCMGAHWFG